MMTFYVPLLITLFSVESVAMEGAIPTRPTEQFFKITTDLATEKVSAMLSAEVNGGRIAIARIFTHSDVIFCSIYFNINLSDADASALASTLLGDFDALKVDSVPSDAVAVWKDFAPIE